MHIHILYTHNGIYIDIYIYTRTCLVKSPAGSLQCGFYEWCSASAIMHRIPGPEVTNSHVSCGPLLFAGLQRWPRTHRCTTRSSHPVSNPLPSCARLWRPQPVSQSPPQQFGCIERTTVLRLMPWFHPVAVHIY